MGEIGKIAGNLVKSAVNGQYCRLAAREMSSLKPKLDAHHVRLIGVGLEELGVEEFVKGNFFEGELYIDTNKKTFEDLGFQRMSFFSVIAKLFSRLARQRKEASSKLGGNLKGDGLQNGGVLVVGKGGNLLYKYVQEHFADHVDNNDILRSLNVAPEREGASGSSV